MTYPTTAADTADRARELDAADALGRFRERFFIPPGTIQLDGNSLGLLSRDAERAVLGALESWKAHGVEGWLDADPPWFTLGEDLGARMAPLMGAGPGTVVVTGTTTVNLHQLAGTFYCPGGARRKVLATALDFPSDIYALRSLIRQRGGDPDRDLVLAPTRDGRTIAEEDVIAALTDEVALALLPSVLYRSGQLLDMAWLTAAAHEAGVVIGFDCAHSAGALPHELDAWGVDFAFWCSYKYLNAGPGAVGALYVNPRHFGTDPALAGWWGYRKERQFTMSHAWEGAAGAGAWQISTPPVLSAAALLGSLAIFEDAGIAAIRRKSLAQTDWLMAQVAARGLLAEEFGYRIGTPAEHARRGGHIAVEHDAAAGIAQALRARGIVVDFRPPDVVRIAPVALYTSYEDLWHTVEALGEIVATGEHERVARSGLVT